MKKNNITLVFVAIVFSIIVGMIIGKSLLKYKEGDPDVVGSFSMNRDENLTVVANRKNISDKEAFARLLLKMYKENSFHSIKFSTDHGYATSLDMTVYSWKEDIENGESIMQIEFRPIEYGKDYDLVHNPDKYVLFYRWNRNKMKYIDMQIKRRKRGLLNTGGYFQLPSK